MYSSLILSVIIHSYIISTHQSSINWRPLRYFIPEWIDRSMKVIMMMESR